jgi:hypothetical protein
VRMTDHVWDSWPTHARSIHSRAPVQQQPHTLHMSSETGAHEGRDVVTLHIEVNRNRPVPSRHYAAQHCDHAILSAIPTYLNLINHTVSSLHTPQLTYKHTQVLATLLRNAPAIRRVHITSQLTTHVRDIHARSPVQQQPHTLHVSSKAGQHEGRRAIHLRYASTSRASYAWRRACPLLTTDTR